MEKELFEFLTAGDYESASVLANKYEPSVLADTLSNVNDEHLIPFCRLLDSELLAEVLVLVDAGLQERILSGLRQITYKKLRAEKGSAGIGNCVPFPGTGGNTLCCHLL